MLLTIKWGALLAAVTGSRRRMRRLFVCLGRLPGRPSTLPYLSHTWLGHVLVRRNRGGNVGVVVGSENPTVGEQSRTRPSRRRVTVVPGDCY